VISGFELFGLALLAGAAATMWIRNAEARFRAMHSLPPSERDAALRQLGTPARDRAKALAAKCAKTLAAYGTSDDLVIDGNRRALEELTKMHLRLLTAHREIVTLDVVKDAPSLRKQIAAAETSVVSAGSEELRESRAATAAILRHRLDNVTRRETLLTQIESDLERIEAQIDLALEDATLNRSPAPVSHSIELASGLFDETLRQA
jgi:hypothetical protein